MVSLTSQDFIIREVRREELEAVREINRKTLPENYPSFYFELHYKNFGKAFLVAQVQERIVGYVMCRVEYDNLFTANKVGRRGHVISIAVLEGWRGRGIGYSLMVNAMEAMRKYYGAEEYYLEVRVSNEPAIRLYKKLGFNVVRVLPGYYLDGEDAYLMARPA